MADLPASVLGWVIPALIVFGLAGAGAIVGALLLARARRSPRAASRANVERGRLGVALVRLDDAIEELDVEAELSGALYDGASAPALRRALLTARRVRDDGFTAYRDLGEGDLGHPADVRRTAERTRRRADEAVAVIARARAENDEWMRVHVSAAAQVGGIRTRLDALRDGRGDPAALVRELGERFAPSERAEAERAAGRADAAFGEAEAALVRAEAAAGDPTRSVVADASAAERALRRAEDESRRVEQLHRAAIDAARAVPDEIAAARAALRTTTEVRARLEPDAADRLAAEAAAVAGALDRLEPDAVRRPTATIAEVARLRDRLDSALGDARTARQRLEGARTALPGAVAAARRAIDHAEASGARRTADARVRWDAATAELAASRVAADPVAALDAARRASRHAEDAAALAGYARLGGH